MLQPYVKSYQLFVCPSNTANTVGLTEDSTATSNSAQNGQAKTSYVPNVDGVGDGGSLSRGAIGFEGTTGMSLSSFENTATTILVLESSWPSSDFTPTKTFFASRTNPPAMFSGHLSTGNFLFVDGHVKSMRPDRINAGVDGSNWWARDNKAYTGADLTAAQTIANTATSFYK